MSSQDEEYKKAYFREKRAREELEQIIEDRTRSLYLTNEELEAQHDLLQEHAEQLRRTLSELKQKEAQLIQSEKMASLGQLSAGVAHEINNPVGYVSSNIETLSSIINDLHVFLHECQSSLGTPYQALQQRFNIDDIVGDMQDIVCESTEGLNRVKEIVDNLRSFSREEEREKQYADINECIQSTVKILHNELKYKCKVVEEYSELPRILCFPGHLNQVFMNIINNAGQAIGQNGTIEIKTCCDQQNIYIGIKDDGCGIEKNKLDRIFEPFFTTKPVGQGTGLGLSLCYNIMQEHDGHIDVDSKVDEGTCFTITIPILS